MIGERIEDRTPAHAPARVTAMARNRFISAPTLAIMVSRAYEFVTAR
jgi:hypothetical protein